MASKKVAFKIPKSLAQCSDLLYQIREDRLQAQKIVDRLAEHETLIRNRFINELPKSQSKGVSGLVANVQLKPEDIPVIKDKAKLFAFIKKNNRFDLLQNRLSKSAVQEMWDDKIVVPGVEKFRNIKVSCTKLK